MKNEYEAKKVKKKCDKCEKRERMERETAQMFTENKRETESNGLKYHHVNSTSS